MAKESSDTLILGDGLVPGKLGIGTLYSLLLGKLVPINECLVNNGKFGGGLKTRTVGYDMGTGAVSPLGRRTVVVRRSLIHFSFGAKERQVRKSLRTSCLAAVYGVTFVLARINWLESSLGRSLFFARREDSSASRSRGTEEPLMLQSGGATAARRLERFFVFLSLFIVCFE